MFLCILLDRIHEDVKVAVGTRTELLGNTVDEVGQRVFFGLLTGRSELIPAFLGEFDREEKGTFDRDLPVSEGFVREDL